MPVVKQTSLVVGDVAKLAAQKAAEFLLDGKPCEIFVEYRNRKLELEVASELSKILPDSIHHKYGLVRYKDNVVFIRQIADHLLWGVRRTNIVVAAHKPIDEKLIYLAASRALTLTYFEEAFREGDKYAC